MIYNERYKTHHDASRDLKKCFTQNQNGNEYVMNQLGTEAKSNRVLYFHVPFCNKICSFCPFHKPNQLSRKTYHQLLIDQMERIAKHPYMKAPFQGVYFGGGTPTSLKPEQMDQVLEVMNKCFEFEDGVEISVESSITEMSDEMIDVLYSRGVNRLSLGVQTFNDQGRKMLNRRGTGERAIQKINDLKKKGFENINIDLIYNYPGQKEEELYEDLSIIKDLGLAGLSYYSLILHQNTPIMKKASQEELAKTLDIRRDYEMHSMVIDELSLEGYELFELTKMIRKGLDRYDYMRVKHNRGSCIPIGQGGGGNIERYFYSNQSLAELLDQSIPIPLNGRVVSDEYMIIDQLIFELQQGSVNLEQYSNILDIDLWSISESLLDKLHKNKLITISSDQRTINLTRQGVFWGNNIIRELIKVILTHSQEKKIIHSI